MIKRWKSIFGLKCPRCSVGSLFTRKGLVVYSEILEMHEKCNHCGLRYDLEPGFWLGALWTSYPIVVLVEFPFLILAIFSEGDMIWIWFSCMILAMFIVWPLMLRLGRSIWIHLNVRGEV